MSGVFGFSLLAELLQGRPPGFLARRTVDFLQAGAGLLQHPALPLPHVFHHRISEMIWSLNSGARFRYFGSISGSKAPFRLFPVWSPALS